MLDLLVILRQGGCSSNLATAPIELADFGRFNHMSQRMTNPTKLLGAQGRVRSGIWFDQSGCALDGLLRVQGFYMRTLNKDQTEQMHWSLRVVHRSIYWFCYATAHICRVAARTYCSQTSIARIRWWSDWVRTDPAVIDMVRRVSTT